MSTILLTPEFVLHGLKCPAEKTKEEFCDLHPDARGMYIEVNASTPNQGIIRFRTKIDGKTTHILIGRTNEITLDAARKQVVLLKSQLSAGINPKAVDDKLKIAEPTFEEYLSTRYFPFIATRKRTVRRDRELAVRVNKAMGSKKLSEINRLILTNFHIALLNEEHLAPSTSDMHIRFIKHALQLAVDWSMLDKNPASRFPMYNVDNRSDDFLTAGELQRFVQTVQASDNKVIAGLIMFMISCGMRLTEAMSIKYCDLNMENRTISIPARNNKSRRLKSIPMGDMAAQAILSQAANRGDSEFVWVNPKTGDRYKNINKAFDVIRKKAGLPTFKIHGLRRTFATTLANNGTSINVIQQLLTHASPVTTDRYIRVAPSNLLAASQGVSSILQSAMSAPAAH